MDAPAVAVSDDGKGFAVAWMANPTEKSRDVFWAVSGKGGQLPAESRLSDDGNGEQGHPAAGTDAEGVYHLVWEDARDGKPAIYAASSAGGGKNVKLSEAGTFPSLAAGKSVGVAWEQGGGVEFRLVK
jgi:hypothetical protein